MSKIIPSVGSPTERLKDVFGVQKVPLASNFSDLIDVADAGRKAAGLSPDQPPGQGNGMYLDDNLKLAVLPQAAGGINVNATGVGVTIESNKGLTIGGNGLAVQPGSGINLSAAGVGVTVESNKGLTVGGNGLAVQPGRGINLSATGVGVTVESNKGLTVGGNGLAVQPGSGINLSTTGVGVTVESNKGLTVGGNGLAVQPANGINLGTEGVSVKANAGRAILVDSGGVGINYGSTLNVVSNKLEVSNTVLSRVRLLGNSTSSSVIWKNIATILEGTQNAYAQFNIMSNGTTTPFKQMFTITVMCDGDANSSDWRAFTLSLTNAVRRPTTHYGINNIRIGRDCYGNTQIDAQITHTGEQVNFVIDYSPTDIEGVVLSPFTRAGQVITELGVLITNADGHVMS
ncbi:hypothetical protein [Pseudomonas chlororaphis]|uniref:hypothetical protein n=1 Tax=Pseudomonas chlororaphis TaxID=587753 RepID=UPI000A805094|nr:hypothetical protein [Pseudomonas chlororaphis]